MTLSGLVEPAFHTAPPYDWTLGPEVSDVCAELTGFIPDPEQQLALGDIFGERAGDPGPAIFEYGIVAPRQNIKTGLFKQCVLGWLFVTGERLIVWSAHEFDATQEAFRDLVELIEKSPALERRVKQIHRGNGDEAIELLTGQRVKFKARTKTGSRSLAADKLVLDEGFALKPVHMGSILPLMTARPAGQVVVGSSAGHADSEVLRDIRDRGREGVDDSLGYLEYSDQKPQRCASDECEHSRRAVGCALDDQERWAQANPQLGRRIRVRTLANLRKSMPPAEFAREALGWWDEAASAALINAAAFADCVDPDSKVIDAPRFALDVSPGRGWAAIGVAGLRDDGLPHVEVTSQLGVMDYREGTHWVVPRAAEMAKRHKDFRLHIVTGSPAASLQVGLETAGVTVELTPANQVGAACGYLYDQVNARTLRHLGQPELVAAANGSRKRAENGETAFVFGRAKSVGDITTLYAVTLALYALQGEPSYDPMQSLY